MKNTIRTGTIHLPTTLRILVFTNDLIFNFKILIYSSLNKISIVY